MLYLSSQQVVKLMNGTIKQLLDYNTRGTLVEFVYRLEQYALHQQESYWTYTRYLKLHIYILFCINKCMNSTLLLICCTRIGFI